MSAGIAGGPEERDGYPEQGKGTGRLNIVKYPGGKEKELEIIRRYRPEYIRNYYEPFVGGGSVYLDTKAERYFINDASEDLIRLYACIKDRDAEFFRFMEAVNGVWKQLGEYAEKDAENPSGLFRTYKLYLEHEIDEETLSEEVKDIVLNDEYTIRDILLPVINGQDESYIQDLIRTSAEKLKRMKHLSSTKNAISDEDIQSNIEGCFKSSFYMYMRDRYNRKDDGSEGIRAFLYLFIRDMCYSSMFRFNANGEYNVPYGGISYNRKNYDSTVKKYLGQEITEHMEHTSLSHMDYLMFLRRRPPQKNDFVFLDPPYDSEFSTYDNNAFGEDRQRELARYLITECTGNFMLDIKNTDLISSLYVEGTECANGEKLRTVYFDKHYSVSFMNRNEKRAEHILLMNYKTPAV